MEWQEVEAGLERRLSKPSPRNFRAIVEVLLNVEPQALDRYAIPYLVERFQDWPATVSRSVPSEFRDRVRQSCLESELCRIFHPVDLDLLDDTEWSADRVELGAQLDQLGIPTVSLRCTADEFALLHAEVRHEPLIHHGDLTITSGELRREVLITGEHIVESPVVEAASPAAPPTPLRRKDRGPADLEAAQWVDVEEITHYLDVPPLLEYRDHFEDVLLGTDFSQALLIPGDVTIDGSFDSAWLERFGRNPDITVVLIDGNLKVSGDIVTAGLGASAQFCLIVMGDVSCRGFHCGSTFLVAVAGVARCAEAMVAHNDHCPIFFADLHTPVAMMDEYWLMGGTQNVGIVTCRQAAGPGPEWPELAHHIAEVFAPELIDESGVLSTYDVVGWLREGREVRHTPQRW